MATSKKKAVFTAESQQLEDIRVRVTSGEFRSLSEFLREAIDEKLERLRREQLRAEVERYCRVESIHDDGELIEAQAFDRDD